MAQPVLSDPTWLLSVSRDVVAQLLDISVRHLHSLVERGVLPEPTRHGVYDLPACLDAYLIYRAKLPVPTTLIKAELGVDLALRARRVYLRRAGASAKEVDEVRP